MIGPVITAILITVLFAVIFSVASAIHLTLKDRRGRRKAQRFLADHFHRSYLEAARPREEQTLTGHGHAHHNPAHITIPGVCTSIPPIPARWPEEPFSLVTLARHVNNDLYYATFEVKFHEEHTS